MLCTWWFAPGRTVLPGFARYPLRDALTSRGAVEAGVDTGESVGSASALLGGRFIREGERSRGDTSLDGLGRGDRVTFGAR